MISSHKKLIFSTLLVLLSISIAATCSDSFTYTPQNSVIVFDLHDVVFDFDYSKARTSFCKLKNKGNFIGKVLKYLFTGKKKRKCIESYVLDNTTDPSNILPALNPHIPNQAVIKIIQELKALNYQVYICSNIGEQSYQYMQNLYPEVFALFDGYYISSASQGYLKKNNPQFFTQTANLIDTHASLLPEKIILIDNERANLKLAQTTSSRFVGLFFKNAIQIRKKLRKLGLDL